MPRRLSVFLLMIAAMVSALNLVCQAQPQAALTHHVREVTANGQAPLIGHLSSTQSMRLVLVLPHRNEAELDQFLREI